MTTSPELVNAAVNQLEAALRRASADLRASARLAERVLEIGLRGRGSWSDRGACQLLQTDEGVCVFARYRVAAELTGEEHELPRMVLLDLGVVADATDTLLLPPSRFGSLTASVLREALFDGLQSIEASVLSEALGSAFLAVILTLRPPNPVLAAAIEHVPGVGRLVTRRLRAYLSRLDDSPGVDEDFLRVVAQWLSLYPREGKTQIVPELTPDDWESFEAAKRVSRAHAGPKELTVPQARAWYEAARPAGALLWALVPTREARAVWSKARSLSETTGLTPMLVPLATLPMALGVGDHEFAPGASEAIDSVSREASDQGVPRGEPPRPGEPVVWPSLEERFDAHRVLALVLVNATEGWRAVAALRDPQAWPGVPLLSRLRVLERRYGVVPMVLDPYSLAGLVRPRSLTREEAWDAMQNLTFAHYQGSFFDERSGGVESLMQHDVWWLDLNG